MSLCAICGGQVVLGDGGYEIQIIRGAFFPLCSNHAEAWHKSMEMQSAGQVLDLFRWRTQAQEYVGQVKADMDREIREQVEKILAERKKKAAKRRKGRKTESEP